MLLEAVDGGTRLRLIHSGLLHGSDVEHAAGWQVHLGILERSLAGEVDENAWDAWPGLRDAYSAAVIGG